MNNTKYAISKLEPNNDGELIIPASLDGIPITVITESAFSGNKKIRKVNLPEGLITIDKYAFSDCSNLTEINFPQSLKTIEYRAFIRCNKLERITLSKLITKIDSEAFGGCNNFFEISVDSKNLEYKSIDGVLFNKDGTDLKMYPAGRKAPEYFVPVSVKYINAWAFSGCKHLKKIYLAGIETIGMFAFSCCRNLTEINLPSSLDDIGCYAFVGCEKLKRISLSRLSMICIDHSAFFGFVGNIILRGGDITEQSIYRYLDNFKIEIKADRNWHIEAAIKSYFGEEEVFVPRSYNDIYIHTISYKAFWGNIKIKKVTLPDSIFRIESSAFEGCTNLTEIILPKRLESIGCNAFKGCINLTEIILPKSLESIGHDAFLGCTNLKTIILSKDVKFKALGTRNFIFHFSGELIFVD